MRSSASQTLSWNGVPFSSRRSRSLPWRGPKAAAGEAQAADAALAQQHGGVAERRGLDAVAQGEVAAQRLVLARRHCLMRHEQVMQPARAGHAHGKGGVQDARALAQLATRLGQGQRLQEALRADPGPGGEQALEMARAEAGLSRHVLKLRLLLQ